MKLKPIAVAGLAALAISIGFTANFTHAQETQGPIAPKPGVTIQPPPQGSIRVRVQEVSAPATVHDDKGNLILNLEKKDFHVFDNGVEQMIDSLDLGGEPLSVVLVFETSSRIAPYLPAVQKSAIVFTQVVVGPSGRAAVLSYDDGVQHLLPFTGNHDHIEKAISSLKTGDSGAHLYDAVSAAVAMLRDQPAPRRRAVIVVGEAKDYGSEDKLGRILRRAQLDNIVIYSVGLSTAAAEARAPEKQSGPAPMTPPGTFGGPPVPGTAQTPDSQQQYGGNINLLNLAEWAVRNINGVVKDRPMEVAATATGGMFQSAVRDRTIEKAVDSIGGELNAQYMLSYHPMGADQTGYHTIKVTVDQPGLKVRTRPGYYLE